MENIEVLGIDYIEFYVGNAIQAMHWWQTALGFYPIAHNDTGGNDKVTVSYIIRQGSITIKLTSPLKPGGVINEKLSKHGDYVVRTIAFGVKDATKTWKIATERGAKSFFEPTLENEDSVVVRSGVHANWGDVIHMFIEREQYKGPFLPGFVKYEKNEDFAPVAIGLKCIDHIVPNSGKFGRLGDISKFYEKIFGFHLFYELKELNEFTSVDLEVMTNSNGRVKFNIIQAQEDKNYSFANEFVERYHGEGVNHIALECEDIVTVVTEMRRRGVEFYEDIPDVYYETMQERNGPIVEDIKILKKNQILVDRDEGGYLLQIFTKPFGVRATTYLEIIERKGATSFGNGTIIRKLTEKKDAKE